MSQILYQLLHQEFRIVNRQYSLFFEPILNTYEPTFGDAVNGGFAMGSNIDLFSEEDEQLVHTTSSSGEIVTFGGAASLGTLTSGGLY